MQWLLSHTIHCPWRVECTCADVAALGSLTCEQLLRSNVMRFRGGLIFKAHRLWYHSTLGLNVIKKSLTCERSAVWDRAPRPQARVLT